MFRQGHPATPHHGVGEGDPAADYQVGGVLGDTPHHEERIVDPVETKGWEGLWLCDTRQGASGYAIPDKGQSTPHREGERGGGSGLAIPDKG